MIIVRTPVTDTLNSVSIAALICGLVASECTRNAYSLRAPYAADDFSVTTGRTMVSCSSGIARLLLGRAFLEGADLHHHRLGPEDLVRGRVGEAHHADVGDVSAREVHVVRIAGGEHQNLLASSDFLKQRHEVLGLRFLVFEGVHDYQRTFPRPRVQRRFLSELAHLLRNAQPVAARMRPMRDAAVPPMRGARRALPRPAGAFLPPRLLVAARDLAASQRVARALPLVRQVRD